MTLLIHFHTKYLMEEWSELPFSYSRSSGKALRQEGGLLDAKWVSFQIENIFCLVVLIQVISCTWV